MGIVEISPWENSPWRIRWETLYLILDGGSAFGL